MTTLGWGGKPHTTPGWGGTVSSGREVCGTVPGSLPAHLYHNKWFVLYVCRTHTEYGSLYIPGRPCFVVERAFETSWMRKCELSPPHHQEDTNTHCPLRTCLLIKEEQQRHARRGLGGGGHPGSPQRERVLCVGSQAMQKRAAFAVLQNAKNLSGVRREETVVDPTQMPPSRWTKSSSLWSGYHKRETGRTTVFASVGRRDR
jgi:hypothetical protein